MDITSEQFEVFAKLLHILLIAIVILIQLFFISLFTFITNYILTGITFYKVAKKQGKNNAYWAWIPFLSDLLIIEIGDGNKLLYLPMLLIFIPQIRIFVIAIVYFYITIVKYRILEEYKVFSFIFGMSNLILMASLIIVADKLYAISILYNLLNIIFLSKLNKKLNSI